MLNQLIYLIGLNYLTLLTVNSYSHHSFQDYHKNDHIGISHTLNSESQLVNSPSHHHYNHRIIRNIDPVNINNNNHHDDPRKLSNLKVDSHLSSVSFYGSSYIWIPMEESRDSTKIFFRFKTHRTDAFLFLASGPKDYCLITISNGNINIRINLGSGEEVVNGPNDLKLNDLLWHEVDLERKQSDLVLTIDKIHIKHYTIKGRFFELNINYGLYIGGLGNFTELFLGNMINFRGCIDQFTFNGIDVFSSSIRSYGFLKDVSRDCSTDFDSISTITNSNQSLTFLGENSYLTLPSDLTDHRTGGNIYFELKTSQSTSSILFYKTGLENYASDFVAIELTNGLIQLTANDGSGLIIVTSDYQVNNSVANGHWHSVNVTFKPDYYEIVVDGRSKKVSSHQSDSRYYDFISDLYIGGIDVSKILIASQQGLKSFLSDSSDTSFKGCIRNVQINSVPMGQRQILISKGVHSNCNWDYPCLVSSPCIDGSTCLQEGFSSFRCFCESTNCIAINSSSSSSSNDLMPSTQSNLSSSSSLITIEPLTVLEGKSEQLTVKNIQFNSKLFGFKLGINGVFSIKHNPSHGALLIDRYSIGPSSSSADNTFTYTELNSGSVRYTHDGSETINDSITLALNLQSKSFQLPSFLENLLETIILPIKIIPVNDIPKVHTGIESDTNSDSNDLITMARFTKLCLTNQILNSSDSDNSDSDLTYGVITLYSCPDCYIESTDNPSIGLTNFTQADVNQLKIFFVHSPAINTETKSSSIKIVLSLTDNPSQDNPPMEMMIEIHLFDLTLIQLYNTGCLVNYNDSVILTRNNLSFTTNANSTNYQTFELRYKIIKIPDYGMIQKLRPNGQWINVSYFNQKQLNEGKVRYLHLIGQPTIDSVSFQISVIGSKVTSRIEFKIVFIPMVISTTTTPTPTPTPTSTISSLSTIKKPMKSIDHRSSNHIILSDNDLHFTTESRSIIPEQLLVITTSQLLVIAICVLTSIGLCLLLMMIKLLTFGKTKESNNLSSSKVTSKRCGSTNNNNNHHIDRDGDEDDEDEDDEDRHLNSSENNSIPDGMLMIDDSGRGSLPYDRASTVMSDLNPYLPNIINNPPSISTNCGSIRSITATPVSTFGRGHFFHTTTSPKFDNDNQLDSRQGNPFPLPPPSLYYGVDSLEEGQRIVQPHLCSFHAKTLQRSSPRTTIVTSPSLSESNNLLLLSSPNSSSSCLPPSSPTSSSQQQQQQPQLPQSQLLPPPPPSLSPPLHEQGDNQSNDENNLSHESNISGIHSNSMNTLGNNLIHSGNISILDGDEINHWNHSSQGNILLHDNETIYPDSYPYNQLNQNHNSNSHHHLISCHQHHPNYSSAFTDYSLNHKLSTLPSTPKSKSNRQQQQQQQQQSRLWI
ncbi:chondroitin sulfate proteoglycan 4-like [Panonychus citri]|uniref:chondroitin sulfate proteoglycan 4-like n=1 Tax=Panonychus citri TaxID=50023 RepID=UPI002306E946|nr:chondroitin sulfate proteoglycan 4-like [Panonychus citri]